MKKIIITIISIFINLSLILPSLGTELPKPVIDLIKEKIPNANIRFDGLIECPDGTKYLPVLPISYQNSANPAEIVMTIPAKASFASKPDLILFANNLTLLKMIKKSEKIYTLTNSPEIPLKVKLGLLPQDLVVPENLVIPPELRIITGDLKIKTSSDASQVLVNTQNNKNTDNNSVTTIVAKSNKSASAIEIADLVNKTLYVTNFNSNLIYIVSPQTGKSIKSIRLSSIPSDITITDDNRYILATCLSTNKVSIIDTTTSRFVTEIEVGKFPVSIVMSKSTDKAYVANRLSSSISIIDIKNMTVINNIPVTGSPANLVLSEDEQNIFYNDVASGKIYRLQLTPPAIGSKKPDNPSIDVITQVNNVAKIAQFDKYLLTLSRSGNLLNIYNLEKNEQVKTLEVGNKPVDIKVVKEKNKLYVLSAESRTISVIDISTFTINNTITLKDSGFPISINILNSTDTALVANADSYEIAIIDLNEEKVIDYLPVGTTINSLIIPQTVNNK
ncbi:MAG: hypothetical protein A2287_01145 [Candidatus Melainabacteria bacterium RIFOXYA12_FULL_32_12]|nr:MAG: hypothetical protein A2255_04030 [Candidatus Melainabacteria bacterium RIFOXYA2_FULL_32_9]OGI26802.1 MAG: hypothetical protein A2287_01145 [Candidatus Melainabacteria bacterium RIFOXYA12_FULL_32_12]